MSNLPNHSPNMVMSRDPGFKFQKFIFSSNFVLNFRKSYQIWRKLAQEQKTYRQKTNWGACTVDDHIIPLASISSDRIVGIQCN